ncbi:MAG TPA: FMN-binding negative transcriptional regulator [Burkholderiales bacterium]|nr:FMN-binding negative transcriptional regulator [Burkholderiales bacterium]
MYEPTHFQETRVDELHRLIAAFPFGILVVNGPNGLDANHIPFEYDAAEGRQGHLIAHVARANPVWKEAKDGDEVLVIFRAADAYISPNWYPSKPETHKHVPTWNYQVVHVHGRLHIRDDERFVRGVVARLTRTHELRTGAEKPWKMTDSAPEFIDQMLANIVGIEVEVTRMTGKRKLGQNREDRDRIGAAQALAQRGETVISSAMLAVPPKG